MPLTPAEKNDLARSLLELFGENYMDIGRTTAYMSQFTAGGVDLLATVLTRADTWQPFIDSGLSIPWWKAEVTRFYDLTVSGF